MTDEEIYNERLKLTAAFMNGVAIAMVTVGVFGPVATYAYGLLPNTSSTPVFLSAVTCLVGSTIIHSIARTTLEDLL